MEREHKVKLERACVSKVKKDKQHKATKDKLSVVFMRNVSCFFIQWWHPHTSSNEKENQWCKPRDTKRHSIYFSECRQGHQPTDHKWSVLRLTSQTIIIHVYTAITAQTIILLILTMTCAKACRHNLHVHTTKCLSTICTWIVKGNTRGEGIVHVRNMNMEEVPVRN